MSTPPKATPTTPQWAIAAAYECLLVEHSSNFIARVNADSFAAIIAKHAPPPAAQPSDAAGLRENPIHAASELRRTVDSAVEKAERHWSSEHDDHVIRDTADRILTALAPYLRGEPGDSELLDAAFEVAVFSKTHEWPKELSPEFFEFATKLDVLATQIQRRYPSFNKNILQWRPT